MKPRRPALALDTSLVQDQLPSEVMPKIFIGSIHSAFALEALNNLHITHVLNKVFLSFLHTLDLYSSYQILNVSRLPATFPGQFTYLLMDIRDK